MTLDCQKDLDNYYRSQNFELVNVNPFALKIIFLILWVTLWIVIF